MSSFQKFGNAHFRGDVKIDGKLMMSESNHESGTHGLSETEVMELVRSGVSRVSDTLNKQIRMAVDTTGVVKSELTKRMDELDKNGGKSTTLIHEVTRSTQAIQSGYVGLTKRVEALEAPKDNGDLLKKVEALETMVRNLEQTLARVQDAQRSAPDGAIVTALMSQVKTHGERLDALSK